MKTIVLAALRLYQLTFSAVLGRQCRFSPSCSDYTRQAVEKHGVMAGLWLGLKRVGRCGPFGGSRFQGEYDPVPDPVSQKGQLWHGAARSQHRCNHKDCC